MKFLSARGACLIILLASMTSRAWCMDAGHSGLRSRPSLPEAAGSVVLLAATIDDESAAEASPARACPVTRMPTP
jgi:hypothetical protein